MERRSRSTWWLVTIIILIGLTSRPGAHDFWLEPSSFETRVGDPVRVHLRVGERFFGEPVVRNESRIERFILAGPGGDRPVIGRDGMDPAGLLRLDAPGIWFVGYSSKPSPVQLTAPAFDRYLREEGLERIIDDRAARKESQVPGREQFSRSVKALLRAGAVAGADGYDRILGLPLEFVLESDPLTSPGNRVPMRLLFDGRPLSEALVVAYRKRSKAASEGTLAFRGRTDADGRVVLPVVRGQWLVKAVHMERAAPDAEADWSSVWTALTFEVPGATQ